MQTLSQGTDAVKSLLTEILVEEFNPRAVIERNDVRVRELEGLPLIAGTVYGDAPAELEILQHGLRFRRRATRRTEDRIVSGPARESSRRARRCANDKRQSRARLLHIQRRFCTASRIGVRKRDRRSIFPVKQLRQRNETHELNEIDER